MEKCEICGHSCTDNICNLCRSQMETGDVSDIRVRVQNHDHREYFLIRDVCQFYGITDFDLFEKSNRQPGAKARKLYVYLAVRHLGFKSVHCANMLDTTAANISRIMSEMTAKMKKEIIRKKFEGIIKKY